jgi:hypothetical protein
MVWELGVAIFASVCLFNSQATFAEMAEGGNALRIKPASNENHLASA